MSYHFHLCRFLLSICPKLLSLFSLSRCWITNDTGCNLVGHLSRCWIFRPSLQTLFWLPLSDLHFLLNTTILAGHPRSGCPARLRGHKGSGLWKVWTVPSPPLPSPPSPPLPSPSSPLPSPPLPSPPLPCPALSCPALPCPALPCPALPCPPLPSPALPLPSPPLPSPPLPSPPPPLPSLPSPPLPPLPPSLPRAKFDQAGSSRLAEITARRSARV